MMNSLSDFTNLKYLNEGEYGLIYKATNKTDNKIYAIKEIKNNNNPDLIEREKNLLKNVSHQNIIRYYSSFAENNINYFVLEYFDGEDLLNLSNRYKSKNPPQNIPQSLIIIILKGVINGLLYLHNRHIMHRDIAPDNIMIDKNNIVKITDFGISKKCNNLDELAKGSIRGKTNYASPEIYKAHFKDQKYSNYNFKTDLFSLGVTMFYLMTFDLPIYVDKQKKTFVRNENFIDPNVYHRKLIDLVESMLIFDENQRPSSLDLYNEMRKLIGDKMMSCTYHIKQIDEINLKNKFGFVRNAFSTVILYFWNEEKIKDYFGSNLVKSKIENIPSNLRIVINSFAEVLNYFEDNKKRLYYITKFIVKVSQKILIFKDEDETKITPKLIIRKLFEYFYYVFYNTLDIFIYNNKNAYILSEKIRKMPNIKKGFIDKINEFKENYANIFSDIFYFPILKKITCPICNNIFEESIDIIYDIEFPQYGDINQLLEEYQDKKSMKNYNNKICNSCFVLPMNYIEEKSLIIAPNILIFHFDNGAKLEEYIKIKEYINPNNKVLYKIDAIINLSKNYFYNIAVYKTNLNNWIYYYDENNSNVYEFNKVIEKGKICIAFYKIYKGEDKDH